MSNQKQSQDGTVFEELIQILEPFNAFCSPASIVESERKQELHTRIVTMNGPLEHDWHD